MNDGKKILAVVLGAIMGFGAVSVISRNFYKEEDEKPKVEQELPEGTYEDYTYSVSFSKGCLNLSVSEALGEQKVEMDIFPENYSSNDMPLRLSFYIEPTLDKTLEEFDGLYLNIQGFEDGMLNCVCNHDRVMEVSLSEGFFNSVEWNDNKFCFSRDFVVAFNIPPETNAQIEFFEDKPLYVTRTLKG